MVNRYSYVMLKMPMDIDEIKRKAEEVIREYNPEKLSPFPYEKIEQKCANVKFHFRELLEGASGAISYDKEKESFSIFINFNKPKTRQHFTIAHELGHYFLHSDIIKTEELLIDEESFLDGNRVLFRLDKADRNDIETQANNFAAILIMPEDLVYKAWEELGSVEECAKVFNVSISAMSIRLERLGLGEI